MVLYKKLVCVLIFTCLCLLSKGNSLHLSTEKEFYKSDETLEYIITQLSGSCNGTPATVYVELLNDKLQVLRQQIIQLVSIETKYWLTLADLDTGYYILRVAGNKVIGRQNDSPEISQVAIGVDIPTFMQTGMRKIEALIYPEGGKALVNFISRFVILLQTKNGKPLCDRLLIKNRQGELVTVCNTSSDGYAVVNIFLPENEIINIETENGVLLYSMDVNNNIEVGNAGFSLYSDILDDQVVYVEMRKAANERGKKISLQVLYKNILLYDAPGQFNGDTAIVATTFPVKGLENKLLRLVLKDENDSALSERLLLIPGDISDSVLISNEIYCNCILPAAIDFCNYKGRELNNRLISASFSDKKEINNDARGFSLFFYNRKLKGQNVNYSILGEHNELIRAGAIIVDTSGFLEIENCTFKGKASVFFYFGGKQENEFERVYSTITEYDTIAAIGQIIMLVDSISMIEKGMFPPKSDSYTQSEDAQNDVKELKGITVIGKKTTRMEELDEKYVHSGMFKDLGSLSLNVEDDSDARNYTLQKYLIKNIPGLLLRTENAKQVLIYRTGYLDFFVDEIHYSDLPELFLGDVGYIKFFRNPVRGGMAEQKGGALLKQNSFAAGIQGSVAIYTMKFSKAKEKGGYNQGIEVWGYMNVTY